MAYNKDDVKRLVDEVGNHKFDPPVEVGPTTCFGLEVDLFDPVSETVITLARPHRGDVGDHPEVLLTADQVVTAVANARANRVHADRARGFVSTEHSAAVRTAEADHAAAEKELAKKHADELEKLRVANAEKMPKPPTPKPDKAAHAAKPAA